MRIKRVIIGFLIVLSGIIIGSLQQPIPSGIACMTPVLHNLGFALLIAGLMVVILSWIEKEAKNDRKKI